MAIGIIEPETVGDLRSNKQGRRRRGWTPRTFRNVAANQPRVVSGPGTFGGIVVLQGAAAVNVFVYDADQADAAATLRDDQMICHVHAEPWDGITNKQIVCEKGIVIVPTQSDALIVTYHR